jgi:poly(3-hydroxybutyrate) depolymerase
MLYHAYQAHSDVLSPLRLAAQHHGALLWWRQTEGSALRKMAAALEVFSRLRLTHSRPAYGIAASKVRRRELPVTRGRRCSPALRHLAALRQARPIYQPPVLLVAPLSGHFATLLRETARTLLQDHDVYITDWHNARDVSFAPRALRAGRLHRLHDALPAQLGPGTHVVAVCQPCVAALAATALMAEDDDPAQPRSLTLMAGPVDCRVNPTGVNELATSKPIEWFEQNLISHVPLPHAGYMRRVYPGFVQLSAFLSMNLERHKQQFRNLYQHLVDGDVEKADLIRVFYDEYLAVNDLPAEFYLETVEKVFQTYDLPLASSDYRGRLVRPEAIRRTWLFTVEGERDDICSVGPDGGGARPVQRPTALHEAAPRADGRGALRGVQRAEVESQIYPRVREMIHAVAARSELTLAHP